MEKIITVTIKEACGKVFIYPACNDSRTFCELIGQKTLTERDKDIIKKLGYTVLVSNSLPASL